MPKFIILMIRCIPVSIGITLLCRVIDINKLIVIQSLFGTSFISSIQSSSSGYGKSWTSVLA